MAVAYWVEQMGQDTSKARDRHLDELRDKELRNFMNHVLGKGTVTESPNWMDV
jgi:hypothetical protein